METSILFKKTDTSIKYRWNFLFLGGITKLMVLIDTICALRVVVSANDRIDGTIGLVVNHGPTSP